MKRKTLIALTVFLLAAFSAGAQKFAVKTNLLYDATATINLGAELGVAPKWTIDLSGNLNAWPINDHKWKHMFIQPEARYWFCDRFQGHFIGAHAIGGIYNIGFIKNDIQAFWKDWSVLTDNRYQGYFIGAGIAYGYALALCEHWNLEFELGLGYMYTRYDKYECGNCGLQLAYQVPFHYFGPTKGAVNLVYVF